MKSELWFSCRTCGKQSIIGMLLTETRIQWVCDCGVDNSGSLDQSVTVGQRLLSKSIYEARQREDYSMSIVFSAMALECEASRLIVKWKKILASVQGEYLSDEDAEESLRQFQRIEDKLREAALLMHKEGLDDYVSCSDKWREMVKTKYPSLIGSTLANSLSVNLFRRRNRILHSGYATFKYEDAIYCYNYALLGIDIFVEMDRLRSQEFKKFGR